MKVLLCFGTRPEIIKLAPVVHVMRRRLGIEPVLCSTGQHTTMVTQMLSLFDLTLDEDLSIMRSDQTVESVTTMILNKLAAVMDRVQPDCVMVQGDTTSAFASGLLAFYRRIPVLHLEAGLRTGDLTKPWPEEANRRLLSVLSGMHFAPTEYDVAHLQREGIESKDIHMVGNTVVDAVEYIRQVMSADTGLMRQLDEKFSYISADEPFVLVTGHRRESHDGGHAQVFRVLRRVAEEKQIKIVFPVHLNPSVKAVAEDILGGVDRVHLLPPVDYLEMQYLLQRCCFVVTDSGGVQEEAPTYGKPVLVTREVTERMAGVQNGSAVLVGTDPEQIYTEMARLIDDAEHYARMSQVGNPYGDGHTADRVVDLIADRYLEKSG